MMTLPVLIHDYTSCYWAQILNDIAAMVVLLLSLLPVDDVTGMEVLDTTEDLGRVVTEHFLIQGPEASEQICNWSSRYILHEDADHVVIQARAEVAVE